MSAPVNELAIIAAIMVAMMVAERIVGAARFWTGVKWVGLVGLAIALAYGLMDVAA